MSITFKEAVRKMSNDPNLKYYYFFCEKGQDGKPVMLVDTKKLDAKKPGPAKEALDSAKAKGTSSGTMRLREKLLSLKPQGTGLAASKLEVGVKLAANQAQVQGLIQDVNVGEPEAEEGEKKQHADPLRADPAIARLLDKKQEIKDQVDELIGGEDPKEVIKEPNKRKEFARLQGELKEVDDQLEEAQKNLNKRGVATQALRENYKDEEKKFGWRTDIEDPKERSEFGSDQEYEEYLQKREQLRESDRKTTKQFTGEERKNAQVTFNEQGRAQGKTTENDDGTMGGSEGTLAGKEKLGYVVDKDGKMHQFRQKTKKTGEKMIHPVTGEEVDKEVVTHHSSVTGGEEVAGAGEMDIDYSGYISRISNKSGHYKPGAAQMIQIVEDLARQGALLDKTLLMPGPDGKGVALNGKAKEIFNALERAQNKVEKKIGDGQDVQSDLEAIKQGKEALIKLGCAPANKFRNVTVEFLDGADKKKAADIVTGTGEMSNVKDFLSSGAGATVNTPTGEQKVSDIKKGVLDELKENKKFKKAKEENDQDAKERPERVARLVQEKFKELPQVLKWYQEELAKATEAVSKAKFNKDKEKAKARQQLMQGGIARIQAALKPTDVSDEGLAKVLENLRDIYLKDKLQVAPQVAVEPMPQGFASSNLDYDKYPPELIAQRLGLSVSEVSSVEDDGLLYPDDLLKKFKTKIGVNNVEELWKKLSGQVAQQQQPEEPMPQGFGGSNLDYDKFPPELIAKRLGLTLNEVSSVEDDGLLYPDDLLKKFKAKMGVNNVQELWKKLSGQTGQTGEQPKPEEPMPQGFGGSNLDYDKYPPELIAQRLGLSLSEVESAEDDGLLYPDDLLKKFKTKIGVDNIQALWKKLSGQGGGGSSSGGSSTQTPPNPEPQKQAKPMPQGWGSGNVDYDEFPPELIAQRLGISLNDVESAEDDGILFPVDLLKKFKTQIGVNTVEELYAKLAGNGGGGGGNSSNTSSTQTPPEPQKQAKPMPQGWGSGNIDYDEFPPELIAQRLGISLSDVESAEDDGILFPVDLLKKFKTQIGVNTVEEMYAKLTGK